MAKDTKRNRTIEAAADLFLRHGFARTTMGDIAQASEMSRPALYLIFPGKEEVFEAAVLHLNRLRIEEIEGAVAKVQSLAEKLFVACDLWLVQVFALQRDIPDARDMDDLSFPVVRKVYIDLQVLLAGLIADAFPAGRLAVPAEELARGLVFAVRGLGATARDVDDMRQMTRLQVDLMCAALTETPLPAR